MSGVTDGQSVNAAVSNAAWLAANGATTGVGPVCLAGPSSAPVPSVQEAINVIINGVGGSSTVAPTGYGPLPANMFSASSTHEEALGLIGRLFQAATGHKHTGVDGDGPLVTATAVTGAPMRTYWQQGAPLTAVTGDSKDVSIFMTGLDVSIGPNYAGVVIDTNYSQCVIRDQNHGVIVDANGYEVFGILDYSAPSTFALDFYSMATTGTDPFGAAQPYTFAASANLQWYFKILYDTLGPTGNVVYDPWPTLGSRITTVAASGQSALRGPVTFSQGAGVTLTQVGQNIEIAAASGSTVSSIAASGQSALTGAVTLSAGSGVQLTQTGQNIQIDTRSTGLRTINSQSASAYTFALSDMISASASPLVVFENTAAATATIPTNASVAFPVGAQIDVLRAGTASVYFATASTAITLNSKSSLRSVGAQHVGVSLVQTAANVWSLLGDLTT